MKTFSIKELCQRYMVSPHTPLSWIGSGQMEAINVARQPGGKPQWRVTAEALEAFELSRMPSPPAPRKRRRKTDDETIQFYK